MDTNDMQGRAYYVILVRENQEPEYVERFDTLLDAIKQARSLAWDNEEDVLISVSDDLGDTHWNNEGDWRSAIA